MSEVTAKKHLGQHFLKDQNIAAKIADSLKTNEGVVLEVGPGMGMLTHYLLMRSNVQLFVAEVDRESVAYLLDHQILKDHQIHGDFLKLDLEKLFPSGLSVIGNFPYNISSQILFKAIDNRALVVELTGMFQKEVAERIGAKPGNKQYGILSVLAQAYFDVEYLFTVSEHVFNPPPKVKSGVIRLLRKPNFVLNCNEKLFKEIIKTTFNTRRKMLRVSLKPFLAPGSEMLKDPFYTKRPEELGVDDFVRLTLQVELENGSRIKKD